MARERRTVEAITGLYCQKHHAPEGIRCAECQELLQYALERLDRCPFQERKTTCAKCPVHCYRPELRERIRAVMRYAGPRMLLRHPILAVRHLWDGIRKEQGN
jgi:hypothetical protein